MPKKDIGKEFNKILKLGEDKIKKFHETRGRIDSFWRILHAIFDKRVYQKCVDELNMAHEDLSAFKIHVSTFYFKNKKYFSGIAKQHLDLYMKYISDAVNISAKRLTLQQLILDINVNNKMKEYMHDIPSMFNHINKSCEECGQLAKSLNILSDEIHDTNRAHSSDSS
ncbi:hypothetical protein [Desulfobacter latus]|uniref:Uncharacterized protein n=1 Tax=Desulfobacter latus TaxID=2292 RepID=A0A850TA18_9BACT|nr:hypothetical protein [Desulfobacter latus]NWH04216.1 hypothetical protein [Desulfobacter latus]